MAKLTINKKFPPAETKVVLIARLKGDSLEQRVLVDFDNEWVGHIRSLLAVAKDIRVNPQSDKGAVKLEVMADLQSGELEGLRGYDKEGNVIVGFFEAPGERKAGARIYAVEHVYYFGLAGLPQWMANK